jgi:hypothetical protein
VQSYRKLLVCSTPSEDHQRTQLSFRWWRQVTARMNMEPQKLLRCVKQSSAHCPNSSEQQFSWHAGRLVQAFANIPPFLSEPPHQAPPAIHPTTTFSQLGHASFKLGALLPHSLHLLAQLLQLMNATAGSMVVANYPTTDKEGYEFINCIV